jgi:hypothetical protein
MDCTTHMLDDDLQKYLMPFGHRACSWAGISPEITTKSETIDILTRLYNAQNVSISNTPVLWVNWKSNGTDFSRDGAVEIVDDRVYEIDVWLANEKVQIRNLLKSIGDPYFVNVFISDPKNKCDGASLAYPQLGLEVFLYFVGKSVGVKIEQFISGFQIGSPWPLDGKMGFEIIYPNSLKLLWDGCRDYCPNSQV